MTAMHAAPVPAQVCQSRVRCEPWSSEALHQLGAAQLACFEADETQSDLLSWAELSFRASLACEGKRVATEGAPEALAAQGWWKAAKSEPKNKMAKSDNTTWTMKAKSIKRKTAKRVSSA